MTAADDRLARLDDLFADALEGIVDLMEHGDQAADQAAAACPAIAELAVDLFTFLEHMITGELTPAAVAVEARAWQVLALQRWPIASPTAQAIMRVLNLLASTPDPLEDERAGAWQPAPPPVNDLERAIVAARRDPSERRRVWEALYSATVHLAVVDFEIEPERQAAMTFLGAQARGTVHTFGFTTAERLQRLLEDSGTRLLSVEATGEELTRFWLPTAWLVLNPGEENCCVLSPAEVKCLPHGPRVVLPGVDEVDAEPVDPDAWRDAQLLVTLPSVTEILAVTVAHLVRRDTGERLPTPVAAVELAAGADASRVLPALDAACASAGVGGWIALSAAVGDRLAELVQAAGRVVYRRAPGR